MYIDKDVLKDGLEKIDNLSKNRIFKRFQYVENVFKDINDVTIDLEGRAFPKAKWNQQDKNFDSFDWSEKVRREIFAPTKINLTEGKRYTGIQYQQEYFEKLIKQDEWEEFISFSSEKDEVEEGIEETLSKNVGNFIKDILSIIGGFDKKGKMKEEYRILSNTQKNKDDFKNSLTSDGQCAWNNSHFADNTLFFEFVEFVRECECKTIPEYDKIALCHPYSYKDEKPVCGKLSDCVIKNIEEEIKLQQEILAYRFPLKFLWMWAKRDVVIHPLSLMAFREFLKSEFMKEIFEELSKDQKFSELPYDDEKTMKKDYLQYAEKITNAKIEYFPDLWQKVSDAIIKKLYKEECQQQDKEELKKISLLISLLTLGETDMTNIDELLKTHKQIILYGVPGTGKTHSAKELIRKWSQEEFEDIEKDKKDQDKIDRLQLSRLIAENIESEQDGVEKIKIVWEIMQFHPNTTYQDFIGGIAPKTDDKGSLAYELRNGKFKEFCEYARVNPDKKFVFIIDEINRANLSEVLGELLYALEYRDEGITIPNFDNKPFVIPSNVYIIGTMNNVDKSLSTFDLALRRRFGFYEIGVDCDVIREMLKNKTIDNIKDYIERCRDLNMLISGEIDDENAKRLKNDPRLDLEKHYQIGQAYFAKIEKFLQDEEEINPRHLGKLWDYHLQPLLEEYIGFSMSDKDISNKLKKMKDFWTKEFPKNKE